MKHKEIERLKEIDRLREKLGDEFELITQSPNENDKFFVVIAKKKDPWEGVEFVEWNESVSEFFIRGKIYKLCSFPLGSKYVISETSAQHSLTNDFYKETFKPSTESAYVEQLKKEAFERFGEIKDRDRFDRSGIDINWLTGKMYDSELGFEYRKSCDILYFGGLGIYQSGKWAKKLPERVKVRFEGASCKDHPVNNNTHDIHEYRFHVSSKLGLPWGDFGNYLAKCLEDYLNKEAGI